MSWIPLSHSFLSSLSHSPGGLDALFQQASDFVSNFDVLWSNCDTVAQRATDLFDWLFARWSK